MEAGLKDVPSFDSMSERDLRYDRGIRLWGNHGQRTLDKSRICLLTCSATGSEALKNMVLGGINSFTIVDEHLVDYSDLGNNFMVQRTSIGKPRAQVVTECLKELNELVSGSYVEARPQDLICRDAEFFKDFDLVIATQLQESYCIILEHFCRKNNILLVVVQSYGLVGMLRNCIEEVCIVESKPESTVNDLRISNPWPELAEYCEKIDFSGLDNKTHGQVPYGILLMKAASEWKEQNGGKLPSTRTEREDFKAKLHSLNRKLDGCPIPELNIEEAIANANKAWCLSNIPIEIENILSDPKAKNINRDSEDFWIVIAAIDKFVNNDQHGHHLPLCPDLPDMHSSTGGYLELQNLYRSKALSDAERVHQYVIEMLQCVGKDETSISFEEVRKICHHARTLRVVRTEPIQSLHTLSGSNQLKMDLACEGTVNCASIYVTLRVLDCFYEQYKRYPGTQDSDLEDDLSILKTLITQKTDVSVSLLVKDDILHEIVRFGAAELHCIAATMGALASQEVIKLLTRQCVPLAGTLIYDAMNCSTHVFAT